jgi:hypothetical protein
VSKEKMVEKFVPFDQVEEVVRYLRLCCATRTTKGYARKEGIRALELFWKLVMGLLR